MLKWHGPGARMLPALSISWLWFNGRMSACHADGPVAIPGSRTSHFRIAIYDLRFSKQAARQLARPSLQNSVRSGQHRGGLPVSMSNDDWRMSKCGRYLAMPLAFIRHSSFGIISGVVADKQCTCPASKLMWERYPPTPPSVAWNPISRRSKRRMVPSEACEGGLSN